MRADVRQVVWPMLDRTEAIIVSALNVARRSDAAAIGASQQLPGYQHVPMNVSGSGPDSIRFGVDVHAVAEPLNNLSRPNDTDIRSGIILVS